MKILSFDTSRWNQRKRPGRLVTPLERSPNDAVKPPLRPFSPLPPRSGDENVVPFKRRDPMRRSRRSPLRRWLKPLALALCIVGSPVALVVWVLTSPQFAFAELEVTTGDKVSQRWVEAALEPYRGQNLLRLPLASLKHRLTEGHPWVAGVDLRKSLPHRLELTIIERRAVAILRHGSELHYLDAEGQTIAPIDASYLPQNGSDSDLVLVSLSAETMVNEPSTSDAVDGGILGGIRRDAGTQADQDAEGHGDLTKGSRAAIALFREIEAARPSWFAGLSEIRVLGDEDFEVFSTDLPFSLLVRAGTVEYKARRFEELRSEIVERFGAPRAVDLRFARRIIVQPYERAAESMKQSTAERRS